MLVSPVPSLVSELRPAAAVIDASRFITRQITSGLPVDSSALPQLALKGLTIVPIRVYNKLQEQTLVTHLRFFHDGRMFLYFDGG